MKLFRNISQRKRQLIKGFSLQEVVTSLGVIGISITGIMTGHVTSAKIGDYSTASAAAQQAAVERLEQTRAAKWDTMAYPIVDELVSTNFSDVVTTLDIPGAQGLPVNATISTTISSISIDPPMKSVTVQCVWTMPSRGTFTNTLSVLRTQDQ